MKVCRRILALTLSLLMILGAAPVMAAETTTAAPAGSATGYTDVKVGAYYEEQLKTLMGLGAALDADGDGKFNPNAACTRATFVEWLWRIAGAPKAAKAAAFTDVAADAAYADAVAWAVEAGVTSGKTATTFDPNGTVTRAQMMTFLYRFAAYKGYANVAATTELAGYSDVAAVPSHAKASIPWAIAIGVMQGTSDGKLNPQGNATRAHASAFMGRLVETAALTRADLEKMIVETGWAFALKRAKIQYDSLNLNGPGKIYGGQYRVTEVNAPEYATSDAAIYSVCSDYTIKVYQDALQHAIMGVEMPFDTTTGGMIAWASDQPNTDDDVDLCLMRWKHADYTLSDLEIEYGLDKVKFATGAEMENFLRNWEQNLRPGDIFVARKTNGAGHALMYIGEGYLLHCSGSKYDMKLGVDSVEYDGAVSLDTVERYFLSGETNFEMTANTADLNSFIVFRPLNAVCVNDGDADPANDQVAEPTVTASAKSRMDYPGMEIDRTVHMTDFGTVAVGETLTYTVAVSNMSNAEDYVKYHKAADPAYAPAAYTGLEITETIPAGTAFVSATGNYTKSGNELTWVVDVPAGETVEVTYTVKVTAKMGETIVSGGGSVAGIPSNVITNDVGGAYLPDDAVAKLQTIAATDPSEWRSKLNISAWTSDLDFAERVYAVAGLELDLPTIQEILDNVYPWTQVTSPSICIRYDDAWTGNHFTPKADVTGEYAKVVDMMVDGYPGGASFYNPVRQVTVNEFGYKHLQPGDILVFVDGDTTGKVYQSRVIIYVGNATIISMGSDLTATVYSGTKADQLLWTAFAQDIYFLLRPYQAMEEIPAYTGGEPEYPADEPVFGAGRPTEVGTTTLSEANLAALAALTPANFNSYDVRDYKFAAQAYDAFTGGLADLSGKLNVTHSNMLKELFAEKAANENYLLDPSNGSDLDKMLVTGFWGGDTTYDEVGRPQLNTQDHTIANLQPGDILYLIDRPRSGGIRTYNLDWVSIYQGDGKFITCRDYAKEGIQYADGTVISKPLDVFTLDFGKDGLGKEATFGVTFENFLIANPETDQTWNAYFVLRPSQAVYDINDTKYAPPVDEEAMSGWQLSADTQAAIAALTVEDAASTGARNAPFGEKIYEKVGMNLNSITKGENMMALLQSTFTFYGESPYYTCEMNIEPTAENRDLYSMIVPSALGGPQVITDGIAIDEDFNTDDMQVGDILWLCFRPESSYWVGVYQGDGKILFSCYEGKSYSGPTFQGDMYNGNYYCVWDAKADNSIMTHNPTLDIEWSWRVLIRPTQSGKFGEKVS